MAKNITIEKDGVAQNFSGVEKLETHGVGGGRVTWIPMDEAKLAKRTVKKNGTYRANTEGYYGYSTFKVKVGKKVSGIDPDDGKPYAVDVDDEGNLIYTELPTSISIQNNPTKTAYTDGEHIDLTGIVVKAYYQSGAVWGTVPEDEIETTPKVAAVSAGASQTVTISWVRDDDGADTELEATFSITVSS